MKSELKSDGGRVGVAEEVSEICYFWAKYSHLGHVDIRKHGWLTVRKACGGLTVLELIPRVGQHAPLHHLRQFFWLHGPHIFRAFPNDLPPL